MEVGQHYFVTKYETKIEEREFYSMFRAKYLGTENYINKAIILTNVNHFGEKRIDRGVHVIPYIKITKMESLSDITNEILPNDILRQIDGYL